MKLEIPTLSEYKNLVTRAVDEALERELPRLIRKATRKQYLNTEEAMELLSCTRKHLFYLRNDIEALPYIKEGRKIYYDIEDIEAYMEQNKVKP